MAHEETHSHVSQSTADSVDIAVLARGDFKSTGRKEKKKKNEVLGEENEDLKSSGSLDGL